NIWVLLVPVFLGFVFLVESIRERSLSAGASDRPQALTLEQLATQGPGGNNYVALTGFTPGEGCVAIYTDRRHRIIRLIEREKPPPSTWELTEAPLFLGADRRRVVAVVEAERVTTESEYEAWRSRREIRGMITGKLVPDSKTGHALQELYPGVDLSNCY